MRTKTDGTTVRHGHKTQPTGCPGVGLLPMTPGDVVRCWPGVRDDRAASYLAVVLNGPRMIPNFTRTEPMVRVAWQDHHLGPGTDYLKMSHIERVTGTPQTTARPVPAWSIIGS